jgi:predicted amidohydrolase YtcJ
LTKHEIFYNGIIHTLDGYGTKADSMIIGGRTIVAVGNNLEKDPEFKKARKINLHRKAVLPGFTDSHTHFLLLSRMMDTARLEGLKSLREVLDCIRAHARKKKKDAWVIAEGFAPARWKDSEEPDRKMLDDVTGGRPAVIFSKDQHKMWVNSRALRMAGISRHTPDPEGGIIDRYDDGDPNGVLKELPAYFPVVKRIEWPRGNEAAGLYRRALQLAYSRGVTGVHSFDAADAFPVYVDLAERGKIGLRVSLYPPASTLPTLMKEKIGYCWGNEYLRLIGIKIFADGSLGSQTALCFSKYRGSADNYGVEATPKKEILALIREAAVIGMPAAIHAIGDRAISNVLDCLERAPSLHGGARHRIEHLQMIRRADIRRVKRLGVIASMQPSHCPSDIDLIEKFWGARGRNCYIFKTLLNNRIPLIFGSDTPIEPLDPIAGIAAAVNRSAPGRKTPFYPGERITTSQAVHGFTAGPTVAVGSDFETGSILPGYKADFVVLSTDIMKTAPTKIKNTEVLATYFDGRAVYDRTGNLS